MSNSRSVANQTISNKDLKKIKIGVYQLVPNQNNTAKFVEKGYVKYGKNFDDETIKLDFLKSEDIKFKIDSDRVRYDDEIYFQFYKDNVASTYMSMTDRIPIFHCSVMYQRKILMGNLFNIYLFFKIENTKSIKSFNELTSTNLKGKYELMIEFNDRKEELPFENFVSYNEMVKDIVELLSSDVMKEIINVELNKKDQERVKQYGKVDDYSIPDKVVNFDELVKKYQENNGNMDEIEKLYNS